MTDGTPAPTRQIGDDASAEVAARAREQLRTASVVLLLYAAGAAMLFLDPWDWSPVFWLGSTAFVVALLGATAVELGWGRGRRVRAGRLLSEYAVLHHVDPGAGRRAGADEAARRLSRGNRVLGWLGALCLLLVALTVGQWDRPAWAIPGVLLLGSAAVLLLTDVERQARAGRRWLADPPGPPRD